MMGAANRAARPPTEPTMIKGFLFVASFSLILAGPAQADPCPKGTKMTNRGPEMYCAPSPYCPSGWRARKHPGHGKEQCVTSCPKGKEPNRVGTVCVNAAAQKDDGD